MSTTFNLWPRTTHLKDVVDLPLYSAKDFTTIQCELIDQIGQEGPTTWELDVAMLTVHDDNAALLVALKWS
jgi:hypothetical protein